LSDNCDLNAVQLSESANYRRIVGVTTISMYLNKIGEY